MTHNVVVTIGTPTRDGLTARLVCHAPLDADCGPYRKPEYAGQCSLTDMFADIAVEAMEEYSGEPITLLDRPVKLLTVNEDTFEWQFPAELVELICEECGRDYPVWFAPNDVWNLGGPERAGFECPSCFAAKYEAWLGKRVAWRFEPEDHQSQGSSAEVEERG